MPAATRYLWHQRLAWLLMTYATGISWVVSPAFVSPASSVAGIMFWLLLLCSVVMVCVKDSALRGRPIPYSWRLPMLITLPIAIFLVEWRARRWSGPAWIMIHFILLIPAAVLSQIIYVLLTAFMGLR
jgi:hypothetical protein